MALCSLGVTGTVTAWAGQCLGGANQYNMTDVTWKLEIVVQV